MSTRILHPRHDVYEIFIWQKHNRHLGAHLGTVVVWRDSPEAAADAMLDDEEVQERIRKLNCGSIVVINVTSMSVYLQGRADDIRVDLVGLTPDGKRASKYGHAFHIISVGG